MIQIDMSMPEKCSDCIFCNDNCSCVASDYNGIGINVGCAYRTERRDIRCPLKEHEEVVRCMDCKNVCMEEATEMMPDMPFYAVCTLTDEVHEPEWFCADGEAKS